MDYITEMQGQVIKVDLHLQLLIMSSQPNYLAAFIIADILIGISLFCALKVV